MAIYKPGSEASEETNLPAPPPWTSASRTEKMNLCCLGHSVVPCMAALENGHDWCPYRKGTFGHGHAQRADDVKTHSEDRGSEQGILKPRQVTGCPQGAKPGAAGKTLPYGFQRGHGPAGAWILGVWPPELRDDRCLLSKPPVVVFCSASLGNDAAS